MRESELDEEGFDAQGYVRGVLAREGLEGVLRIEAGLINGVFSPRWLWAVHPSPGGFHILGWSALRADLKLCSLALARD